MKATACAIVSAAAVFAASAALVAQDASKGAALLAEARRAVGGEEKLRAIKTLDVRGDFKRSAGQTTIEGELQVRLEAPDKLRRDEDLSLPGGGPAVVRTEALNGSTVWEDISGGGGAFVGRFGRGDRGGGGGALLIVAGRGRGGRGGGAPREQATLQMTLGNYKTVNGVKLPHLITRGVNDMTIEEWTIDSYRLNPSFKADVFTK